MMQTMEHETLPIDEWLNGWFKHNPECPDCGRGPRHHLVTSSPLGQPSLVCLYERFGDGA